MPLMEPEEPEPYGNNAKYYLRPPGALAAPGFTDKCVQCADCIDVCPSRAIGMDDAGYPVLLHPRDCGKCGLCADVCSHRAIEFTERTRAGFKIVLAIENA
ncbi:MAG: 4Fe-4S dicluster domain-containing protein [Roseobacter sp.]